MLNPRPCDRVCQRCGEWKHFSRFRSWRRHDIVSTAQPQFDSVCRDCRQIERNERKNANRPLAIVEGRAAPRARAAGVPLRFFMREMNWRSLVAPVRAAINDPDSCCTSCGHRHLNERDVELDHVLPPRGPQDWARQHARNIRIVCASCNRTKGRKDYTVWLDEQEGARISNERHMGIRAPIIPVEINEEWLPGFERG